MSNFQDDPRRTQFGGSDKRRKEKTVIRIGDEGDEGRQQNNALSNTSNNDRPSIKPIFEQPQANFSLLGSIWNASNSVSWKDLSHSVGQDHQTTLNQKSNIDNISTFNISSLPSDLSFVTTDNLRKIRQEEKKITKTQEDVGRPTAANPIIPQAIRQQPSKNQALPSLPSDKIQQKKAQIHTWDYLTLASINRTNAHGINPSIAQTIQRRVEQEEQEEVLDNPRKRLAAQFSATDNTENPEQGRNILQNSYQVDQKQIQDDKNASNIPKHQSLPIKKEPLNITKAQNLWNPRQNVNSLRKIAPSFKEKLQTTAIQSLSKPELSQNNQIQQLNSSNADYLQLLRSFVSEEVAKYKTTSIYYIIDRLDQALPSAEQNGMKYFQLFLKGTKVSELKEYIPYIASIKRWYSKIQVSLHNCREVLLRLEQRKTEKAQEKLLQLKRSGAQAKKVLNLCNVNQKTFNLIVQETTSTIPLISAYIVNNKTFSFCFPDSVFVAVSQHVSEDYQWLLKSIKQILLLYPDSFFGEKVEGTMKIDVNELLVQKLVLDCGNLELLKSRVRRMKAKMDKNRQLSSPNSKNEKNSSDLLKKEWRMVSIFREIQSMINRRKASKDQ